MATIDGKAARDDEKKKRSKTKYSSKDTTSPPGLEVLQASYGAQGATQDVTKETQRLIKDGSLSFTVGAQTFGILDPAPGVKKTFQANISINGAPPTLFTKDDGEQIVVNAPTVDTEDAPKSAGNQSLAVIWYFLVALIGSFFVFCSYYFGAYGLKSSILGWIFASIVTVATVASGVSESGAGPFGLVVFIWGVASFQAITVFIICLFSPDSIDFSYAKKQIQQVVEVAGTIEEDPTD
jgi:hypothetical protein